MLKDRNALIANYSPVLLACTVAMPGVVLADAFPERPVRLIVPFSAGGSTDFTHKSVI